MREVLKDPVQTVDGHVYERAAIEQWFRWHRTSPMTGTFLTSTGLLPVEPLRRAIEEYLQLNPDIERGEKSTDSVVDSARNLQTELQEKRRRERKEAHRQILQAIEHSAASLRRAAEAAASMDSLRAQVIAAAVDLEALCADPMLHATESSPSCSTTGSPRIHRDSSGSSDTSPACRATMAHDWQAATGENMPPERLEEVAAASRRRFAEERNVEPPSSCLAVLWGHSDQVNGIAALGIERMASVSSDKSVKVWDVGSGMCLNTLADHSAPVTCVCALRPDVVASGSEDLTVKVWDVAHGELFSTLEGHSQSVRGVAAVSPDRLVTSSDDKTLKIWDITTGQCMLTLEGHQDRVRSVATFGPGFVASGSFDQTVKIWNANDGRCIATLKGHQNWVRGVADVGRGRLSSCADDKTVRIWDITAARCLHSLEGHDDFVTSLAMLGGGLLGSGSDDKTVRIWNVQTPGLVQTLRGHQDLVRGVAGLGPARLASCSADLTMRVWGKPE